MSEMATITRLLQPRACNPCFLTLRMLRYLLFNIGNVVGNGFTLACGGVLKRAVCLGWQRWRWPWIKELFQRLMEHLHCKCALWAKPFITELEQIHRYTA